jgi:hypothetical protein
MGEREFSPNTNPVNSRLLGRFYMRYLKSTILGLVLTMVVSSTALAGNIGGLRTTGNIGGTRAAGNIGGTKSAVSQVVPVVSSERSRLDMVSENFASLIRLLLDSGALL